MAGSFLICAAPPERVDGRGDHAAGALRRRRSFTPDGEAIYITRRDPHTGTRIVRYSLKTKATDTPLDTGFHESSPMVSPDGKWLALATAATGAPEVYLLPIGGSRPQRIRISTQGGRWPRWSKDGTELFFIWERTSSRACARTQRATGTTRP